MSDLLPGAYAGKKCLGCSASYWPLDDSGPSFYNCLRCLQNPSVAEACAARFNKEEIAQKEVAAREASFRSRKAQDAWRLMIKGATSRLRSERNLIVAKAAAKLKGDLRKTADLRLNKTRWIMLVRGMVSHVRQQQLEIERRFTEMKLIKLRRDYHELRQKHHKSLDSKKPAVVKKDSKKPAVAKQSPKKPAKAKEDPEKSLVESGIDDDSVPPVSIRMLNLGHTRPMLNNAPISAKACDTIIEKTMIILDESMRAMIDADATRSEGINSILSYQTGLIAGSEDVDMSKLAIKRGADDRLALLDLCHYREPALRAIIRGRMSILVPVFRMMDQKAPEGTRALLRALLAMRLADPHLVKLAKTAVGCSRARHNMIRRNLFRMQFGIVVVHAEARALLQMLEAQD